MRHAANSQTVGPVRHIFGFPARSSIPQWDAITHTGICIRVDTRQPSDLVLPAENGSSVGWLIFRALPTCSAECWYAYYSSSCSSGPLICTGTSAKLASSGNWLVSMHWLNIVAACWCSGPPAGFSSSDGILSWLVSCFVSRDRMIFSTSIGVVWWNEKAVVFILCLM